MGQRTSAETEFNTGGGAQGGSSSRETPNPVKICYYELLEIARDATQDDIKKAYKKKALELHPDRNFNDVERATGLFMEVQGAYEVLSDPQERAWYDSHREVILRNDQNSVSGDAPPRAANVTTTEDILKWFSIFASRLSYDDSDPKSFYTILGKSFRKLAEEETVAAENENEDAVYYPDFGGSKSDYESWVKNFYTVWGNFRTTKTFSWCDVYRYSEAPDRRIKRIMEKENKKLRDAAIREFNDIVRSFVMFVRKRDPRFIPNTQTEAQRQAALLAASKEQAARQRAENAAKLRNYKAADWTQVSAETVELYDSEELEDEDGDYAQDKGSDDEGDSEEEEIAIKRYECIVCKKTFGSEGQMNAHERSKKHTKAVYVLKRQMQKENKEFDLDRDVHGWEKKKENFTPLDDNVEEMEEEEEEEEEEGEEIPDLPVERKLSIPPPSAPIPSASPPPTDDDADHVTQEQFEARILGSSPPTSAPPSKPLNAEDLTEPLSNILNLKSDTEAPKLKATKIGKAKARRAKKAAQPSPSETDNTTGGTICTTCKQPFQSNTKMFNHLRDNPSHAIPVASTGGENKGKKKGKRK